MAFKSNILHGGTRPYAVTAEAGKFGRKTFNFFTSQLGRGVIISDDEEITGVISIKDKSRKKSSIRDRLTDTLNYR